MSLLFLLMSVLSAWLTYNVYRPRYHGPRGGLELLCRLALG